MEEKTHTKKVLNISKSLSEKIKAAAKKDFRSNCSFVSKVLFDHLNKKSV